MSEHTDPTMWDQFVQWRNQQQAGAVDVLPPPEPPIPGVPTPAPAPAPPPEPEPEPEPEPAPKTSASEALPEVGAPVEFRYFDPRAGSDADVKNTSRFGVVVEIVHNHADGSPILDADNQPAPAARIGWLTEVSDPVPIADLDW